MNVTLVSLRPTEAADAAGRPALTPELLAASGARYSRNNEGLEAILGKIDPNNLDKSVDGLFKMIDYGHQSIADMAPVAMFLDGVSIWLAYLLWAWSPTAGGQESSTRYIKMSPESVYRGVDSHAFDEHIEASFKAYETALAYWTEVGAKYPERTRIPNSLWEDSSDKAQKQVARMMRNFAFDRARVFLPVAAKTNVMLVMSARAWVGICQRLLSHPLPEANALGDLVRGELGLATPRLLKHAIRRESFVNGFADEQSKLKKLAQKPNGHLEGNGLTESPDTARLSVFAPNGVVDFAGALTYHDNRYAFLGSDLERTAIRFSWDAMTFGEIRDLNRHRTGSKYGPGLPVGFYWAEDEVVNEAGPLMELKELGRAASLKALNGLRSSEPEAIYWCLLGTQFPFEHTTTADKFLYEAELRTGTGAHYRYAKHLHDALELWYAEYPETKGLVLEGSAEPE